MTYHVHAFTDILGFTLENLTDTDIRNADEGDILAWTNGKWINRAPATEAVPTGLADGGELNIGPGPNDIEALAGLGVIVDSYTNPIAPPQTQLVDWPQFNEPITAAPAVAGSIVWFSIADSGNPSTPIGAIPVNQGILKQYATPPGPSLARMEIFLGVAVHSGTEWKEVSNPKVVNQAAETLREIATTVLPLTSIISGGEVQELPSFQLEQLEGVLWEQNRNWHVDKSNPNREVLPAQSPLQWKYVNRDLSVVGPTTDTVLNDQWDNGGVIETIPGSGNTATIQRLYLDPANNYWLLYGQELYPDFLTAQANLNAYNPEVPLLLQNSILLGSVVAEKAPSDWTDSEANFIPNVGSVGSTGGGTPITDFINLNDTPASYTGEAGKKVVVNQTENALEFVEDTGGGYWEPGTDPDNIVNTNSGNVGIGTANPKGKVEVSVTSDNSWADDIVGAGPLGSTWYYTPAPHELAILNNANHTGADGYESIVLNAGYKSTGGSAAFARIAAVRENNTGIQTSLAFWARGNTGEAMRITSAGNVGIGTTSPAGKLDVRSSTAVFPTPSTSADDIIVSTAPSAGITIYSSDAGTSSLYFGNQSSNNAGRIRYSNVNNDMRFTTNGVADRMTIDSAGRVGIGEDNPVGRLDIFDATNGSAGTNSQIRIRNYAADGAQSTRYGEIGMTSNGNNGNSMYINANGGTGEGLTNGTLQFWVNDDEKMRITSDGTVKGLFNNNTTHNANGTFVTLTQAEYDGLTPDADTIYFIVG